MIQIYRASIHDLEPLAILFNDYRIFYQRPPDLKNAKEFLHERIIKNESVIYMASDENHKSKGFVQLYPLFSSTRLKRLWLLNDLYVIPASRGLGIGYTLIESAKKHCIETDGCGLILETAKNNVEGNQLYPKTGFILDEEHNYYSWEPLITK